MFEWTIEKDVHIILVNVLSVGQSLNTIISKWII